MSSTETHFGKLRKVNYEGTLEEFAEKFLRSKKVKKIPSYCESWVETLRCDYNGTFFISGEDVWETFDHTESGNGDIDIFIPNPDGTITFIQQFYNGGTCLTECIEENLEKLKKSNKNKVLPKITKTVVEEFYIGDTIECLTEDGWESGTIKEILNEKEVNVTMNFDGSERVFGLELIK